ncbi:hypothetical protein TUM12370_20050 [Salmonella enterica subsp. enterica serovar Choleraesuis]|nr:hypothetical protein TUM12370_20050 [Salmonella enterica subsp. enterica serovar Choleraesuis]
MSHFEQVTARVDSAIAASVITGMNELLVELSDDTELSREQRYQQQQRLRNAIAHHGQKESDDRRLDKLTQGGSIL